ncbi:MAG: class I SAM-dependent methyltransferase [Trichocoleus desertorum ATA4-8-CV12]|jgi:SAM-dependent methyltransferase|nr:class I SAM-dependent methyltransferase [Trichocoleus desertorum ATA4-8-CV12]
MNQLVQFEYKIKGYLKEALPFSLKSLKRGYGPELDRYSYQTKYINFNIKPDEKVLDIGSGGYPFPLATHLADRYEGSTTHRTEKLKRDSRPLTICSVEQTPFQDNEFDFVYCSHVLEHVSDPAKACREIMRIGKRGYIETPSKLSDVMFNFTKLHDHHKWHVQLVYNTLIFIEWQDSERRDLGTDYFFRQFHSRWKNPFQDLVHKNRDLFVNMLLWKENFNYIVINKNGEILDKFSD